MGNRNPFLACSPAQQQRARPDRARGHFAKERCQVWQFPSIQQAGCPVGKASDVFQVVPHQQRGVFLQVRRHPPPLLFRGHVREIQARYRRPDFVDHTLQPGRLRSFKRRIEHSPGIGHPRRLQEPSAQRQGQFRLPRSSVTRQVHHRVRFQSPFQLPKFCLPPNQSILAGHWYLQFFRRRFFRMDYRRSQRVRFMLGYHWWLVFPRLIHAGQLPVPKHPASVERHPLRRVHQTSSDGRHCLRHCVALRDAPVKRCHRVLGRIRMQRSRQDRHLSDAGVRQRHRGLSPSR